MSQCSHQLLAQRALAGQLLAEDGPDGQSIQHQLLRRQAHAKAKLPAHPETQSADMAQRWLIW
jgi:hypothetical protein